LTDRGIPFTKKEVRDFYIVTNIMLLNLLKLVNESNPAAQVYKHQLPMKKHTPAIGRAITVPP